MTSEQILQQVAEELRLREGGEPLTYTVLASIFDRAAESVGYREWEDRMGDDL